jgi:dTDP-4-dehydrorhamnose reductase
MKSNVVIFGNGYVGTKVASGLPKSVLVNQDITNKQSIIGLLKVIRPSFVINCAGHAGYPNIDSCEKDRKRTWESNVKGPHTLFNACSDLGIFFIHLSSGCLLRGNRHQHDGWTESDLITTPNFYLYSKAMAESLVNSDRTAIVRIRMPIDCRKHHRNLLTKIANFKFVTDGLNSVTLLDDLVKLLKKIINEKVSGIIHCVNPEPLRISQIRKMMVNFGHADRKFYPIKTHDLLHLGLVKHERCDAVLNSTRLLDLGLRFKSSFSAIEDTLSSYGR